MNIQLKNISKRYDTGWIIKDLDLEIHSGDRIAIKGPNGSGKSTLIQMIAGYLSNSKGKICYNYQGKNIDRDDIYRYISIATAYSELDEELNAVELFRHFKNFKAFQIQDSDRFLELVDLSDHRNKAVKYFSSGMKQRLILGLALCMDLPLLILDEPGSFLDKDKKRWFNGLLADYARFKTVIIASNEDSDLEFCDRELILKPV